MPIDWTGKTLAERIDHGMRLRGMTNADLARAAEVHRGTISKMLHGWRGKATTAELIAKIAKGLRVSETWLRTGAGPLEAEEGPLRLRHRPEWVEIERRIRAEHPEIDEETLARVGAQVDDPEFSPSPLDVPLVRDMAAAIASWRVRAARRGP